MRLTIILFDGVTALDVVGGYAVLSNVPGVEVEFAAATSGLIADDMGRLGMQAYRSFDELADTDILYVPGGPGVGALLDDAALLHFIQRMHAKSTWTVSICNGARLLGAAGLLQGKRVSTNWVAREQVAAYGAQVVTERYCHDGKLLTGAGVSASIDTGLYLAGQLLNPTLARTIQLGIEYYPDPPFGNGTPESQPAALRAIVRGIEATSAERMAARTRPF